MEKTIETICKALASKKAVLIRALNVRGLTSIADDFVLATTRNKKQAQAAADEVEEKLGDLGIHALRVEGYREGDWILLDFGDVIVHIFTDEERRRYDFDTLRKEAPVEENTMKQETTMNKEGNEGLGPRKLKENSLATLTVKRIASFGAFLDAGTGSDTDDILLHNGQQLHLVKVGDLVHVFLYHDPHHRLTASMRLPQIPVGGIGYAPVMLTTRFGAFVDVGTERGIFLPFSQMEERVSEGQSIWVKLYVDKTGRLAVTMKVEEDIRRIALPAQGIRVGDTIKGSVYNKTGEGTFIITRERVIAFLHRDEVTKPIPMGAEVEGRVTYIRKDGHVNISLRPQKEKSMEGDMKLLLDYMDRHNGTLPFTDKSDPTLIKSSLGISKAAFKRAVGHLLKQGMITMDEGKIRRK